MGSIQFLFAGGLPQLQGLKIGSYDVHLEILLR
jgi:hypothetical protein